MNKRILIFFGFLLLAGTQLTARGVKDKEEIPDYITVSPNEHTSPDLIISTHTYDENMYFVESRSISIFLDIEKKLVYCSLYYKSNEKKIVRQSSFSGQYYDELSTLLHGAEITEDLQPEYSQFYEGNLHDDITLLIYKNDTPIQFQWYGYPDDPENPEDPIRMIFDSALELSEQILEENQPANRTYNFQWERVELDRRDIFFGSLEYLENIMIRIDRDRKEITCSYVRFSEGENVNVSRTYGESYYNQLLSLMAEITVMDREWNPEDDLYSWDAGSLHSLAFYTGGPLAYSDYINDTIVKSDFIISGNTEPLIAFIDRMGKMTARDSR